MAEERIPTQLELNQAAWQANEQAQQESTRTQSALENKPVYSTANAQLFADYFAQRHDETGHLTSPDASDLSYTENMAIAEYGLRRDYEKTLKDQGYTTGDIALLRAWDKDDAAMPLVNANPENYNKMMSVQYAQTARDAYDYDEALYGRYVQTGKELSQEQYDPDGDGHYNLVESVLDEFAEANDDEVKETFEQMDGQQRRMLAFDGVRNEDDYVDYVRKSIRDLQAAREAAKPHGFFGHVWNFLKGVGHGFISGIMDIIKLPATIVSLGGALFTGTFDNPISRAMHAVNKGLDFITVDAYDKMTHVDLDSWSGKVGNIVGQAGEIALEATLTLGVGPLLTRGIGKLGIKVAEKGGEGLIARSVARFGNNAAARAIEKEALKSAEKAANRGAEKIVTDAMLHEASRKMLGKAEGKFAEEATAKALIRLSKRGMSKVTKKELERLGLKAAEKGAEEVAAKGAQKAIGTTLEKVGKVEAIKKGAAKHTKRIFEGRATNKAMTKALHEADYNMISKMMARPGKIGKTLQFAFGRTDSLTKLFALKSFANSVNNSAARGESPYTSLARAMFAYGTTNMVWGRMAHGNNAISKMINKGLSKEAGAVKSTLQSTMLGFTGEVVKTASIMTLDGSLQSFIQDGLRKVVDDDGNEKFRWGFDLIMKGFSPKKIGENFLSAFVMNLTGSSMRMAKKKVLIRGGNGYLGKRVYNNTMLQMDKNMSDGDLGLGGIWREYKGISKRGLPDDATELEIIDNAADIAIKQGGALGELILKNYVRSRAHAHGIELGHSLRNAEKAIYEVGKNINTELKDIQKGNIYSHEVDMEKSAKFRMFVEHLMMKNANLGRDAEIPSDISMPNWQPEDYVIAHAMFMGHGAEAKSDADYDVAADKAMQDALKFKRDVHPDVYNALLKMKQSDIATIAARLRSKDPTMERYMQYIVELEQVTHGKEPGTPEFKEAIEILLHKYGTELFNDAVASGVYGAQDELKRIGKAKERIKDKLSGDTTMEDIHDEADKILDASTKTEMKPTDEKLVGGGFKNVKVTSYDMDKIHELMAEREKIMTQPKFNALYEAVYDNSKIRRKIQYDPKYAPIKVKLEIVKGQEEMKNLIRKSNDVKRDIAAAIKDGGEATLLQMETASDIEKKLKKMVDKLVSMNTDSALVDFIPEWEKITGLKFEKFISDTRDTQVYLAHLVGRNRAEQLRKTPGAAAKRTGFEISEDHQKIMNVVNSIKKTIETISGGQTNFEVKNAELLNQIMSAIRAQDLQFKSDRDRLFDADKQQEKASLVKGMETNQTNIIKMIKDLSARLELIERTTSTKDSAEFVSPEGVPEADDDLDEEIIDEEKPEDEDETTDEETAIEVTPKEVPKEETKEVAKSSREAAADKWLEDNPNPRLKAIWSSLTIEEKEKIIDECP